MFCHERRGIELMSIFRERCCGGGLWYVADLCIFQLVKKIYWHQLGFSSPFAVLVAAILVLLVLSVASSTPPEVASKLKTQ